MNTPSNQSTARTPALILRDGGVPTAIPQGNEDQIKRRIQLAKLRRWVGEQYKNPNMLHDGMKQEAKGYWEWDTHMINLMNDNQDPLLQAWLEARQKVALGVYEVPTAEA